MRDGFANLLDMKGRILADWIILENCLNRHYPMSVKKGAVGQEEIQEGLSVLIDRSPFPEEV